MCFESRPIATTAIVVAHGRRAAGTLARCIHRADRGCLRHVRHRSAHDTMRCPRFWLAWTSFVLPLSLEGQDPPGLTAGQIARITAAGEDTAFVLTVAKVIPLGFDLIPLGHSTCFDERPTAAAPPLAVGDRVRNTDGTEGFVLSLLVNDDNEVSLRVFLGPDLSDSVRHAWQDFDYWSPDSVTVTARRPGRRSLLRVPRRLPSEPCAYLGERLRDWMARTQFRERECRTRSPAVSLCVFQAASGLKYDPELVVLVQSEFRDSVARRVAATYRITGALGGMVRSSRGEGPTDLDELDADTEKYLTLLYGSPRDTTVLTNRIKTWRMPRSAVTRQTVGDGQYSDRVTWSWQRPPAPR